MDHRSSSDRALRFWAVPAPSARASRVVKLYNPKRVSPFSLLFVRGKLTKRWEGFQAADLAGIERDIKARLR